MSDTKSEAREFWIACPEFGDFDYCQATVSKDPECVEREGDFKFSALHVIEMSTYQGLKAKHERVLQMLEIAEIQLEGCRGAMSYAYEDRCDQYYLNVAENIIETIAKIESLK